MNLARNWDRSEEILAFVLYCSIPLSKTSPTHPQIVRLAQIIGRTPDSVSMKLSNFARLDPALRARGIKGLPNGSKLEEQVWNEFHQNWEGMLEEHNRIMDHYENKSIDAANINISRSYPEGYYKISETKQRVNQDFFRKSLMISYGGKCCITGMNIPSLLIASHIKPWNVSDPKTERVSPTNGLLLNAFHDRAFDKGYITIDKNFVVHVSSEIRDFSPKEICDNWLFSFEGSSISLPEKFHPDKKFIEYHNDVVFRGGRIV